MIGDNESRCGYCGRTIEQDEYGIWQDAGSFGLVYCHDQDETHDGLRHLPGGEYTSEGADFLGGHTVLTVGQLRRILADRPDHEHVIVGAPLERFDATPSIADWYNVDAVGLPDVNEGRSAVTFYLANTFDPRQF